MKNEDRLKELLAEVEERMMDYIASVGVHRTKPWKVKELAIDWGCTEPTIYGMLNTGLLEGFYIGKGTSSLRITPESVINNEASRRYVPRKGRSPIHRGDERDAKKNYITSGEY